MNSEFWRKKIYKKIFFRTLNKKTVEIPYISLVSKFWEKNWEKNPRGLVPSPEEGFI